MVEGARQLVKLNGYNATSFGDVVKFTSMPRGSIYFHFPEGKEQLGIALVASGRDIVVDIVKEASSKSRTPQTFIKRVATRLADRLEESDYSEGCPIAAVAIEKSNNSPVLRAAATDAFEKWSDAVFDGYVKHGLDPAAALEWSMTAVAALEGGILVGKTLKSRKALDQMGALLASGLPA